MTPQDHQVATAQIIQVRLEVATVVVNRALRRLDQVIERRSFGGPGVLTHDLVEEIDCLVQFQLANVLQMLLAGQRQRSEEHTSELQSLMRISYAVFCLKKQKKLNNIN